MIRKQKSEYNEYIPVIMVIIAGISALILIGGEIIHVIEIMANDFDFIRHYDIIDNVNRLSPQVVGYANRGDSWCMQERDLV